MLEYCYLRTNASFFQIFYCSPLVLRGYLQLCVCFFSNSFLELIYLCLWFYITGSIAVLHCLQHLLHLLHCISIVVCLLHCISYCISGFFFTALTTLHQRSCLFTTLHCLFTALHKLLHQWFFFTALHQQSCLFTALHCLFISYCLAVFFYCTALAQSLSYCISSALFTTLTALYCIALAQLFVYCTALFVYCTE